MITYGSIIRDSAQDGIGLRVVYFLQGCSLRCPGCHNPELLSFKGGTTLTNKKFAELVLSQLTPLHKGVVFSGGNPIESPGITRVCKLLKEQGVNIWLYTGFTWDKVKDHPCMKYVDVVVDGPYIRELRDISLAFRGSSNQSIIDVPASLKAGEKILWEDKNSFFSSPAR